MNIRSNQDRSDGKAACGSNIVVKQRDWDEQNRHFDQCRYCDQRTRLMNAQSIELSKQEQTIERLL